MKQISKNEKIVVLITFFPRYTAQTPDYMDYKAENLNGVHPCIQAADGSLRDLRTSEPVATPEKNFVLWRAGSGTVFEYPDGKKLLISRLLNLRRTTVVIEEGDNFTFNPLSMVLHKVKNHVAKEVA